MHEIFTSHGSLFTVNPLIHWNIDWLNYWLPTCNNGINVAFNNYNNYQSPYCNQFPEWYVGFNQFDFTITNKMQLFRSEFTPSPLNGYLLLSNVLYNGSFVN
mgnify:CR=1 FL=1